MWDDMGFGYVWRQKSPDTVNPACFPMTLTSGTIFLPTKTIVLTTSNSSIASSSGVSEVSFQPACPSGSPVTYVLKGGGFPLPILTTDRDVWKTWVTGTDGSFRASMFPLLYSISICMCTVWILLFASCASRKKRPILLKLSLVLSAVYCSVIFGLTIQNIKSQYYTGYLCTVRLADVFSRQSIVGICLGFNVVLLFSCIQTTMGLFPRAKEKTLVLAIGGILVATSQILWGVSIFLSNDDSVLPAFVYLLQIAQAILYACCVIYYVVNKRQATLCKSLLPFTFLTLVAVLIPIVLFIVDVNGWWIINWVDSVSWVSTLLSVITVWEWYQYVEEKFNQLEQSKVLGYQIFDEAYELSSLPDSDQSAKGDNSSLKDGQYTKTAINTFSHIMKTPTPSPEFFKNHPVLLTLTQPIMWFSERVTAYFVTPSSTPQYDPEREMIKMEMKRAEQREQMAAERHFHPMRKSKSRHVTDSSETELAEETSNQNDQQDTSLQA